MAKSLLLGLAMLLSTMAHAQDSHPDTAERAVAGARDDAGAQMRLDAALEQLTAARRGVLESSAVSPMASYLDYVRQLVDALESTIVAAPAGNEEGAPDGGWFLEAIQDARHQLHALGDAAIGSPEAEMVLAYLRVARREIQRVRGTFLDGPREDSVGRDSVSSLRGASIDGARRALEEAGVAAASLPDSAGILSHIDDAASLLGCPASSLCGGSTDAARSTDPGRDAPAAP